MGGRRRPEDRRAVASDRRAREGLGGGGRERARAWALADEIGRAPYRRAYRTSISGALSFAAPLFAGSGYRGLRRIIDVSGDGVNNQGMPVAMVRDELVAQGFTINGLPIMLKRPSAATMDIDELDVYYEDCVIGGPGSLVIPIKEREACKKAHPPTRG